MQGSAVHCSHCGHNHVLQRIDAWRERRNNQISSRQQSSRQISSRQTSAQQGGEYQSARLVPPLPVQQARAQAKDSTLIRFPKRPQPVAPPPPAPPAPSIESLPEWRQRLDARLQQIREHKALETEPPAPTQRTAPELDRNPKIASALNRIQRVTYLQPIRPAPHSRAAVAAELAPEPPLESVLTSSPISRRAEAKAPTLTPVPSKPALVLESFTEPEPPIAELPEDLLSEVIVEPWPKEAEKVAAYGVTTLEAASLPKRAAAAVIDAEIIAFSLLPLFAVYFFLGGWVDAPTIYLPLTVSVVLIALYFFLTYALAGRTMGMAFMNLHLASQSATAETAPPASPTTVTFTFQQAALRALGGTITLLVFPLNVFFLLKNYDRLSLSDSLSGTQVVKIKK